MASPEAKLALRQSKITLMGTPACVFFCTVMLSMRQIWDNTESTAYTDGKVIGWNETFFLDLTPAERIGVMLHEILHVAFTHMLRTAQPRQMEPCVRLRNQPYYY